MNAFRNTLTNRWLLLAVRFVLGFIFVYAAMEKITQPAEFAKAIANYHFLPQLSVNLFALVLPWMELLAGLALIAGVHVRGSALLLAVLLTAFTCAVALALARGLDISCGCFGTTSASKVGWTHLLENIAMLAGAVLVGFATKRATNTAG